MALKWIVTHNVSVATKSANPEHLKARTSGANDSGTHRSLTGVFGTIKNHDAMFAHTVQANMDIFNFKLSQKEMESLDKATFASEDWGDRACNRETVK